MDRRLALARATDDALKLRGTVMLEVAGDERRWCAVCASVQGHLELRVGEPRRGWRTWRRAPGEQWLQRSGFTQVLDAWAHPVRFGASSAACAEILDGALEHGLGARQTASLLRTLIQPGVLDEVAAPPPDAVHADHIAAALGALIQAGRGKAHFNGGRPARLWAWAFVLEDALLVEPESSEEAEAWRFPLSPGSASEAARRLIARLHDESACSHEDPLFIGLIDVGRGDGDGYRVRAGRPIASRR